MSESVFWTDKRTERLRALWAEGGSASQIAYLLGCPSRNSVIGKARRLNLEQRRRGPLSMTLKAIAGREFRRKHRKTVDGRSKRATHHAAAGFVSKLAKQKDDGKPTPPRPLPDPDVGPDTSHQCSIFQLTNRTCRWPVWPDDKISGLYCGALGADFDKHVPYCPAHARLAYNFQRERASEKGNSEWG